MKDNKSKNEKIETDRDPIVGKVLDLQIYNLPLFKICEMLDIAQFDLDVIMEAHGYIRLSEKYMVKPKPVKKTKKAKKTTKKRVKKEKTKKELLEEEYKRNPAKRGTFDFESQLWVVNLQLVEVIELQLQGKNLAEIAKHMKMSKPALLNFMEEKGYVFEDDKFIQEKQSRAFKEKLIQIKEDEERRKREPKVTKPRVKIDTVEDIKYKKEEFEEYLNEFEKLYNWYLGIKEHPIFNK